jgi:hypothetical protein
MSRKRLVLSLMLSMCVCIGVAFFWYEPYDSDSPFQQAPQKSLSSISKWSPAPEETTIVPAAQALSPVSPEANGSSAKENPKRKVRTLSRSEHTEQIKALCVAIEESCKHVPRWVFDEDFAFFEFAKGPHAFGFSSMTDESKRQASAAAICFDNQLKGKTLTDFQTDEPAIEFRCYYQSANSILTVSDQQPRAARLCFKNIIAPNQLRVLMLHEVVGTQLITTVKTIEALPVIDAHAEKCVRNAFETPPMTFSDSTRPGFRETKTSWFHTQFSKESTFILLTPSSKLTNPSDADLNRKREAHEAGLLRPGVDLYESWDYALHLVARYSHTRDASTLREARDVLQVFLLRTPINGPLRPDIEKALATVLRP